MSAFRACGSHWELQATVEDDLPELERAIHVLAQSLPEDSATGS
jgi:hypothetical protein